MSDKVGQDAQVEHWFYHLQQSTLEAVLPDILEKTRAKNWRVLLKIGPCLDEGAGEPETEMARLDKFLWTYKQDAFLPHGRDDEPLAEHQPILLTTVCEKTQGVDAVILVGGAEMQDVSGVQRCITILDGRNEQDKAVARKRWKQAGDAGLSTAYWQQDDHGRWIKPKGL